MDSNTTKSPQNADNGYSLIWIYLIWISYFFFVCLTNLSVALTILRYQALRNRKEYVMMCALCLTDFIDVTSSYSSEGLHRLTLIYQGLWSIKRTVWSCVVLPHNLVHWAAQPASALMLLTISLDRFICVAAPVTYFKLTKRYAYRMWGTVYIICVVNGMLCVVFAYEHIDNTEAVLAPGCFTGATLLAATNKYYSAYMLYVFPVGALISVVFYLGVGLVYWKKKQQSVSDSSNQQQAQEHKRQQQLTKSLAFSCMCTTLFVIIPIALANTGEMLFPRMFHQIIWLFPPINPLCNVIIYIKRQQDVRKAMKAMFTNKEMPPNVNLWYAASIAKPTTTRPM